MPRASLQPIDHAANAIAIVTFVLIVVRSLSTADANWDTLQYHWPYAARAAGLCDMQCFTLGFGLEQRYLAFPMLFHTAFGLLWRAFGTPVAGHAATIAVVVALCAYLWRRFSVPLAWSWLALLAIPLVQIHLSSSYVDLAANAALTIGILALLRIVMTRDAANVDVVIAWAALGLTAGAKLLLIPMAALVWAAIVVAAAHARWRRDGRVPWAYAAGLAVAGMVTILPQLAYNAWQFHNPFYPVTMRVAGVTLPGIESLKQIQNTISVSTQWIEFPRWIRWVASVFEFDAFRGRGMPWTVDQADVLRTNPSYRMGGYFCIYVLGLVAILLARARARGTRPMLGIFIVATVICAFLPNSHELRYYQFWMLTLASIVMVLAFSPLPEAMVAAQAQTRNAARALVLLALAGVMLMTGTRYILFAGTSLDQLVSPTNAVVDAMPAGSTLCFAHEYRYAILYSQLFHPGSSIHVRSIDGASAPGCDKVIELP